MYVYFVQPFYVLKKTVHNELNYMATNVIIYISYVMKKLMSYYDQVYGEIIIIYFTFRAYF